MAKKKEETVDLIVDMIEEDTVGVADESVMARPKEVRRTVVKEPDSSPQPISRMNLTSEQKKKLIHDELDRILHPKDELPGIRTTTSIRCPVDDVGFTTVEMLFNVDARIAQIAWDYYKYNAEKPTVKEFADELTSIIGVKEYNRRVVRLNLN